MSSITIDWGAKDVDQFCAWASISRAKLYKEASAGRIQLRKIGRKSVVTAADADAWLNALPAADMREAA